MQRPAVHPPAVAIRSGGHSAGINIGVLSGVGGSSDLEPHADLILASIGELIVA
jgi:hypothetical protein